MPRTNQLISFGSSETTMKSLINACSSYAPSPTAPPVMLFWDRLQVTFHCQITLQKKTKSPKDISDSCGYQDKSKFIETIVKAIKVSHKHDVFISYRRSNGSHLASLLKLHLTIRKLKDVFLDVDNLKSGSVEDDISESIKSSRNFVLILTPESLDRCIGDEEQEDWLHKEIYWALKYNCKIIPVFDINFCMPDPQDLPSTIREITTLNGVHWIHEYQSACVDKIYQFLQNGK